jgi:hypothetical protein
MNLYCGVFLAIGLIGVVAREIINIKKKLMESKLIDNIKTEIKKI